LNALRSEKVNKSVEWREEKGKKGRKREGKAAAKEERNHSQNLGHETSGI